MVNDKADSSGTTLGGRRRTRRYIPRQREDAKRRLMEDYFGDGENPPKYSEMNFRRSSASTSNRLRKAKTSQQWTTAEEITLCKAWCNVTKNYVTRDALKRGFLSEVVAYYEKETGRIFEDTMPSSPNGKFRFLIKLMRLMSFTLVSNGWTKAGLLTSLCFKKR
ncbi:hypothetical protein Tco_1570288 [Tanacetum coccineum]